MEKPLFEIQPSDYHLATLENKIKIVFLDFDGVICNPSYCIAMGERGGYSLIEPRSGLLVRRLCEVTGAKIVISSTWRLGRSKEHISDILGAAVPYLHHYILNDPKFWVTGCHVSRQIEIDNWLTKYQEEREIEVEQFVILDDDHLYNPRNYQPMEHICNRQVWCDQYDGFGFGEYMKAEAILTTGKMPEF